MGRKDPDEETALLAEDAPGASKIVGDATGFKPAQVYFLVGWLVFALAWITGGVMAAMAFEGWGPLTGFYVIVQIVTTIGYGDITVTTEGAKLFMAFYVFFTLLLIASFVTDSLSKLMTYNENFLRKRLRIVEAKMSDKIEDEQAAKGVWGKYNELASAFAIFWFYAAFGTVFYALYEPCSCSYGVSEIGGCIEGPECSATGGATKTWIDAFYMSIITLTTVGFGDHTPRSYYGRLIGCFWMLFGVVATANMLGKFSALMDYSAKEEKRLKSMSKDIFKRIDADKSGALSMMEFRSFALLKFGLITEADMDEIDHIFHAIDKDGSGHLSFEEIERYCGQE